MRTWLLSPSYVFSVKTVESINAENRSSSAIAGRKALATAEGGPLVGRTSRREPQLKISHQSLNSVV